MDERLDAYVRGGFHSYDTDSVSYSATYGFNLAAAAALPNTFTGSIAAGDGTDIYYGIGVEYDVWKEDEHGFGVRLDYTRYDLDDFGDLDVVSLTGQYEFDLSGY